MRNILTACALCAVALAASAQGAAQAHVVPSAQHDKGAGWIKTASAGTAEDHGAASSLMNVAAHDATAMQAAAAGGAQKQAHAPEPEHRRRTGPAMLIAALAVMSAIALRRLGASDL